MYFKKISFLLLFSSDDSQSQCGVSFVLIRVEHSLSTTLGFYFDPFLAGFLEREDFYACKIDDDTEKCYLWIFLL